MARMSTAEAGFVLEMLGVAEATLQQVAWMRRIARRYLAEREPTPPTPPAKRTRDITLDGE